MKKMMIKNGNISAQAKACGYLIIFFFIFFACAEKKTDLDNARWHLENGFFREAEGLYKKYIDDGGKECEGYYGLLLSRFLLFGSSLISSLTGIAGLLPFNGNSLFPQADMDSLIDTYILPLKDGLIEPIISSASHVIEKGCSFYTEKGIEVLVSIVPEKKIWIGKDFRTSDAFLMRGIARMMNASLSFIASHDISMTYEPALNLYTSQEIEKKLENDIVGLLRELAILMDSKGEFLNWHPQRKTLFSEVNPSISGAIDDIKEWINLVFLSPEETGESARDNLFGYVDVNGNGKVDTGDELWIGIMKMWSEDGSRSVSGIEINEFPVKISSRDLAGMVFFSIGDAYIRDVVEFMEKISSIIKSERNEILNLSEFNKIIPFGIEFFPDTISIDLRRLIPKDADSALPLRRLLPVWGTYDPPGENGWRGDAHPVFLIEGEVKKEKDVIQEVPSNDPYIFCYTCLSGPHFRSQVYGSSSTYFSISPEIKKDLQEIPDDCLSGELLEIGGMKVPAIYVYWQDPTFNGSIYVNLKSIENCAPDKNYTAWMPADNYSINKALNQFYRFLNILSLP